MKKVFDDPDASDPSHSLLSKDHFGLILNEPAGKIAKMVVEYTVNLIVQVSQSEACIYYATSDMSCLQAWSNDNDPHSIVDRVGQTDLPSRYKSG